MDKNNLLDDLDNVMRLDKQNMLGSLQLLSKQVEQIHIQAKEMKIPLNYGKVKNIVVIGMGGSALGAHVFKSVYANKLTVPVEIINNYNIPKFISKDSLVIASSYSGTTEEVLSSIKEAKKAGAKVLVICAGGALSQYAKKNNLPALVFDTDNNPSNQPRMGLGYSIIGQLILLSKTGLLKLEDNDITHIVNILENAEKKYGQKSVVAKNSAKQLALWTIGSSVWFVASEHLVGNAHIAANQLNENAKRFGGYFELPELNHHLMEGMVFPEGNRNNLLFVLLQSKIYHERTIKRYEITRKVLDKKSIHYFTYDCYEKDLIGQACELLVFNSYVSYYSAILQNIDPSPIPTVDFFKANMK